MTQQVADKQPTLDPRTPNPETDECRSPVKEYTDYRLKTVGAAEESARYEADRAVIGPKYEKLGTALQRYTVAWAAEKGRFQDLLCRLTYLRKSLEKVVTSAERHALTHCWEELRKTTTQEPDCEEIVKIDCTKLKDDEGALPELQRLDRRAAECLAATDKKFDDLVGLPERLPAAIAGLTAQLDAVEKSIGEPRRAFVGYLGLDRDISTLKKQLKFRDTEASTAQDTESATEQDMESTTGQSMSSQSAYACEVNKLFRTRLLPLHVNAICVKVAIRRATENIAIKAQDRETTTKNLVDMVLQCADRGASGSEGTSQASQAVQQSPSATIPDAAAGSPVLGAGEPHPVGQPDAPAQSQAAQPPAAVPQIAEGEPGQGAQGGSPDVGASREQPPTGG